jgi:hypothetical protein
MTTMTKIYEINKVSELIDSCTSIDQMGVISKVVDQLELSQPKEKSVIWQMRQDICDMTFKFYFDRYGKN